MASRQPPGRRLLQAKGDDCVSRTAGALLQFFEQARLQVVRIGSHFAGGDFLVRRTLKAELANAQPIFGTHGRTEDAAGHRTRFVELAESSVRVEHGTRLVIGEALETLRGLVPIVQYSADGITGKILSDTGHRMASPPTNCRGACGIAAFQVSEASLQAKCIELIDREGANAALRASGAAGEPLPTRASRVGQRRVDDLYQLLIACRWKAGRHSVRIPHAVAFGSAVESALHSQEIWPKLRVAMLVRPEVERR